MSIRQYNLGSIVKPGFNPLGVQTSVTTYEPYLYAWGRGIQGQLGLGNSTSYSSPVSVGSLTNWLQVSGGYAFYAAVKTDGTLWTWGSNAQGQLGQGNTTNRSSPVQVGAETNWGDVVTSGPTCFAFRTVAAINPA